VLKFWTAAAIVTCIASTSTAEQMAQGPMPHPDRSGPPKQVSKCAQQCPCSQQDGTEDHPLVVKLAQTSQANGKTSANEANTPSKPNQGWSLADKIAVIATAAGFLQFVALLLTIWIMVRNARRQLRAYIIAETGTIGNVANPDPTVGPPRLTPARIDYPEFGPAGIVHIKNVGQTPAYDVLHWGSLSFREWPLKSPLETVPADLMHGAHRSPAGPGVPITKTLHIPDRLTDAEIASLKNGTGRLYWNGFIEYTDIFRKKHFTCYRLMHGAMTGAIGVSTDLTFAEDGNYTDDSQPSWWQFWKPRQKAG